jgi:hypothetical protein
MARLAITAFVAFALVAHCAAQGQLCIPGGTPGSPRNVRGTGSLSNGRGGEESIDSA